MQANEGPSSCLSTCPPKTYKYQLNNTCLSCDESCFTCSGGNFQDCLSCFDISYFLQAYTGPSSCLTTCPLRTYKNTINNTCLSCHESCFTCLAGTFQDCLSCFNISYFLQSNAGPTSCSFTCPPKTYKYQLNNTCLSCDESCFTCSGGNFQDCLSCFDISYFLQANTGPSSCLSTCPLRTYKNALNNTCLPCHESCYLCSGGTFQDCLNCFESSYFLQANIGPSSCLSTCPSKTYKYLLNSTCLACHESCSSCSAGTLQDCLSCLPNSYLVSIPPSSCKSYCNDGDYQDQNTSVCLPCHISCNTCISYTNTSCKSCNSPNFLQSYIGPASCLPSCPPDFFQNSTNNTCLRCDSYSLKLDIPKECKTNCPIHYYFNNSTLNCIECDNTCNACNGSGDNYCVSCSYPLFLYQGSCLNDCPKYYFKNIVTLTCDSCHHSCLTCNGSHEYQCISCENETRILTNMTFNFESLQYIGVCSCISSYYDNSISSYCFGNHFIIIYLKFFF